MRRYDFVGIVTFSSDEINARIEERGKNQSGENMRGRIRAHLKKNAKQSTTWAKMKEYGTRKTNDAGIDAFIAAGIALPGGFAGNYAI